MKSVSQPVGQPGADLRMLVGRVVVDDEMEVEVVRHVGLDVLQETQQLLATVTGFALRHDLPVGDVEGSEQRRRPLANVVVGNALDVDQTERQHRLTPFERLDLRLLVDAQHEGIVGELRESPTMSSTFSTNSGSAASPPQARRYSTASLCAPPIEGGLDRLRRWQED